MFVPAPLSKDLPVLVAVPAFGAPELTDQVLADLLGPGLGPVAAVRVVVVDNAGDYRLRVTDDRVSVYRPGRNLRWIGSANWAAEHARQSGLWASVTLNNDTRLSPDFLYWLLRSFVDCDDVAVAAPTYDDFWLHQRAVEVPSTAGDFVGTRAYRSVPFCDGTALAMTVAASNRLGPLDTAAFPRHGYGSDIDLSLRARDLGLRCVVTEAAYLSHRRRGTMDRLPDESSARNRAEILTGLDAKWGDGWRARAGLGPQAFTGVGAASSRDWYAERELALRGSQPRSGR